MTERTGASWVVFALAALCAGAIVAAVLVVGPASGSQSTVTRTATVARGVVQSTVSGTGNLQPESQLNLGFKTGGAVTHIYVKQGQEVAQGQLLATLDPQSAEVTLEQARASLQSAEANLAKEEETNGEGSGGAGGSGTSKREPSPKTESSSKRTGSSSKTSTEATATSTISTATREANLASARAAAKSGALTVRSDEQSVQATKLYAPEAGTIASLSGEVGEAVSASGTTRASASAAASSGSGSGSGGSSATGARSGAAANTGSSSASSSSSSAFAVLSDLSSMELVVPLSESEIGNVRVGQIATVTIEALSGRKVAAHVREVAILSTSNSGVVSYDVTFQLDQLEAGLKPGMSATAEVVVKQAEGINVPTSAISADTVTVVRGGKHVSQRVVTGLAGNSSTIILSGLQAGETIVLPSTATSTAGGTSSLLGRRAGALGLGGAGGFPGGGAAFFRGGG
ncbi:MAG TPA: biotin/lipoyl-binding protein [Solirubrobacteraceae bacterium]|nr:biotin/lipoyl-binding protein [Solirubrobacteraceae bacterium]